MAEDINRRIYAIEERNRRVEKDKAWETSNIRRFLIAIITYLVIVLFFWSAQLPQPFVNAIVPTIGFILSTLSLSYVKKWWLNKQQ